MSLNKFCTILKAKRRSESEGTAKKHGKNKRQKSKRAASPSPSSLSMRTDRSMDPPTNFKDGETFSSRIKRKRETSPVTSYISLKSDNLMSASKGNASNLRVRAGSPTPTCLSLNTDWSMDPPTNFKDVETFPLDSRLLTEQHLRCPVCKSMLKDPVSIPCGHNYCNSCINAVWENCAVEYICPRCGKASETRPVLNINATLAEVVKNFQLAGFSPALPPQSYAGPEDVACDFCPERKLKSVKYCLTCDVSLCETHVRQHYTIPGLQKHTLSDVTGDIKTRPFQNSDHSFNNTDETQDIVKHLEVLFTPGPTIPTTHKPESTTDVEPEPTVRKITELGIIPEPESEDKSAQEMAVTGKLQTRLKKSAKTFRPKTKEKKDKVRSIALICSTLQQEVSGLKEKLSKLETMNTRKSIYEDGEEYDYEINSGEEDDDDDDEEEDYGEEYDYEELNSGEEEEDDEEEEDYGEEEEKDDGDDTGDYSEKDFDEESDEEEEGNEDGFDEDGFKDMYDGEDDFCVENEDEDDNDKDNSEEDYDDDTDY